jgi:hypothetical protein
MPRHAGEGGGVMSKKIDDKFYIFKESPKQCDLCGKAAQKLQEKLLKLVDVSGTCPTST